MWRELMELVETYTFGGYLSVTELPENVVGRIETCRRHSKRRWEASTTRHLWYKRRSWSDKMSLTRRLWCRRCRYQVTQKQKLSYDSNATEPEKYFYSRTSKNVCWLILTTEKRPFKIILKGTPPATNALDGVTSQAAWSGFNQTKASIFCNGWKITSTHVWSLRAPQWKALTR